MNYTMVGTGNMAWFLASRLYAQGYSCKGVFGRNAQAAASLAASVHAPVVPSLQDMPPSDCCIIAVSDRSIGDISQDLQLTDTVVIHTAGSVPLNAILQPQRAVVWPVYSINKNNLPTHRNIPFVIEASGDDAGSMASKLAYAVSDIVQEVSGEQRQYLHLCAVVANNFTNHLMALCEQICNEQSLPFSLIRPILHQTFDTATAFEPSKSQTGPAIRNDRVTVEAHAKLLAAHPQWQQVYRSLSASIEDMYKGGKE